MQKQRVTSGEGWHQVLDTFERETYEIDDYVRIERRNALAKGTRGFFGDPVDFQPLDIVPRGVRLIRFPGGATGDNDFMSGDDEARN